jgi:hypothetical protein
MVCKSCKNEFDSINVLKFCPYCGTKIEETASATEQIKKEKEAQGTIETRAVEEIAAGKIETNAKKNEKFDTLTMPVITKEQIRQYKREKFLKALIKPFKELKIVITIITLVLFISVGTVGYLVLAGRPVDEGSIKQDLTGKTVTLPKGTSFEIKKGYIKSFSITERNTSKGEKKDQIKAAVTLNNGTLEVNTQLSLQYVYEGSNRWKISDKVELVGETAVKPLVGMDENQILDAVKNLSIKIGDTQKALNEQDVKTLGIDTRTPDFDNLKEDILIAASIDSGIVAAEGKIKCTINFENEAWSIAGIERNSTEDFALVLSPAFSQEKLLEVIKKDALDQTVTHPNVFSGRGFLVKDSFTKSINIADKKFDGVNKTLNVTAKKQNAAGELKTTFSTEYTFAVSFSKVELTKKSKSTVESVAVNDISKDIIVSSIANAEIEGNNIFLWYSNNHKITADEAKTFNTSKVFSKKGLENVKYVYGSITYKDGGKQKTTNVVATYYLVYDSSRGYNWKLDRIVGEESPNYKLYIPEPK